ncbi:ABC transporter permease [Leucobacter triazinivorans]|uniref:ABC transporter permease n=1 Tax=Leucobacter triazinivorans TaxID=1784719 RepID=A0A4P6KF49_9MICO|nr:ABC transporter permease [Leucobacter triazinivorans]QBE48770.1 ABC transporter permease [Leucobacter triazinivorans]
MSRPVKGVLQGGVTAPLEVIAAPRRVVNPWLGFGIRRFTGLLLSFCLLVVITFLIVPLIPGDPATMVAGEAATPAQVADVRAALGLDQPLIVQFWEYVKGLFSFDLGRSFFYGGTVSDVVLARLPYTVTIALLSITCVLLVGVPCGLAVALVTRGGRNRGLDHTFNALTSFVFAIPNYVLATLLILVFAIEFRWFPPGGVESPLSYVLPTLAIMSGPTAVIARIVRRETAVILEQDYIRTARGWRLSAWVVNTRYVLPNILTTVLTLSGLMLAGLLGGAVVIETVFALPGLGSGVITAIINRDYPVIRGIVLLLGMLATIIIVAVDFLLAVIDPRKLTGAESNG